MARHQRKRSEPKSRPSQVRYDLTPWRRLPHITRVTSFFLTAEVPVDRSDQRRLIVGRNVFPTDGVPPGVSFVDWSGRIDRFVMKHLRDVFEKAIDQWGAETYEDDEWLARGDCFECFSEGDLVFRIRPTRATVAGVVVIGNFLVDGDHWQKLRVAVDERYRFLESGVSEDLMRLLRTELPGVEPHLFTDTPDGTSAELEVLCMAASTDIRLHRQLVLSRPAILRTGNARVRILPVIGDDELLICPFSLDVDRRSTAAAIVLPSKKSPVPVVVDARADDDLQTASWALGLLAFAALTAPEPARDDPARPRQRAAHPGRRARPAAPRERRLPRSRRLFSRTLEPVGGHEHAASFVAGHRRRLYEGRHASSQAIARARAVGIILRADETWVRPFERGTPKGAEIEFNWQCPAAVRRLLRRL